MNAPHRWSHTIKLLSPNPQQPFVRGRRVSKVYGLDRGLRVPGMALLGYRPFGPSPSRSAFSIRHARHPSVHCSLATAVGNQHGSQAAAVADAGADVVAPSRTQGRPIRLQEPPRATRTEPEAGPVGSTTGLPMG